MHKMALLVTETKLSPWILVWASNVYFITKYKTFTLIKSFYWHSLHGEMNFLFMMNYFKHFYNYKATCIYKTSLSVLNKWNYGQAHSKAICTNPECSCYKIPFTSTNIFGLTLLNFSIPTALSGCKYLKSS